MRDYLTFKSEHGVSETLCLTLLNALREAQRPETRPPSQRAALQSEVSKRRRLRVTVHRVNDGRAGQRSRHARPSSIHARQIAPHAAGPYGGQPGGPHAGSPPFPPPCLIRPAVRRLPWSPRFLGPGPHSAFRLPAVQQRNRACRSQQFSEIP